MTELKIFKNELFEVGAKVENDTVLFDAEHVAKCLGISRDMNGKEYVRWERVNSYLPKSCPEVGKGDFIPESMVYKLAFKASNDVAEQFQDWLAIEVIPSIRKDGGYIFTTEEDDELTIMAKAMMIANKTMERQKRENKALHKQIEADAPFTKFGKVVAISDGAVNIGTFAKMIYEKHGVNIGRNKLIAWLRENGYLIKQMGAERNLPKQRYIEQGWFRVRPAVVARTDGDMQTGTTLITGKGQIALTDILLKEFTKQAN
ncbi:hypothetical protein A0U40_13490 [[Bacillus] sp. KCTC 13219]|nr:hypothetical protein A0U40_13490 [[Bacillus] sp. KCTC 13219]